MTTRVLPDQIRDAAEAIANDDWEWLKEILADDVVWHCGGASSLAGDYVGRDAVVRFFEEQRVRTRGAVRVDPTDILTGHRFCMVFSRVTGQREAAVVDGTMTEAMRFSDDGRLVEYWSLANDQAALDAVLG